MEEKLVKQLSELTKKSQLFDILIAVEYSKLFIGDNTNLTINESLPNYNRISKFFETYHIPFDSFSPSFNVAPPSFEVQFGVGIDFQDIFIIASILKIFGLKSLKLNRDATFDQNKNEVYIGSYNNIGELVDEFELHFNDLKFFLNTSSEVISVDDFLRIPFDTKLSDIIVAKMCYPDDYFRDLEQVVEGYWRDKGVLLLF